jgi:hypothetical protein
MGNELLRYKELSSHQGWFDFRTSRGAYKSLSFTQSQSQNSALFIFMGNSRRRRRKDKNQSER